MPRTSVALITLSFAICGLVSAQQRPRVTQRVDNSRILRLSRTTHPAARIGRDLGRVASDLEIDRVLMELQSSPEQHEALDALLAEQHDPSSPRYQRWLTPEEFGEMFGPSQADVDAVTQWLESQGMRVNAVARGRRFVGFSGTAGQMERAFPTEVHHYDLTGEHHVANSSDIAVPWALSPVIGGIASMHTFRHKPMHHLLPTPLTELSNGSQGLSPYDFATIYNVKPLWNNG